MSTSSFIGKILLGFFTVTIGFVGYLYYLGASGQEPIEEVLVDGQWVRYQEMTSEYPGEVSLNESYQFSDGSYANPLNIAGEAESAWFYKGTAYAEVIAEDGDILWEGFVEADERYIYDMVVPFSAEVDVGDYIGEATFIMYHASDETIVTETEVPFAHAYSAGIIITEPTDIDEIEEETD